MGSNSLFAQLVVKNGTTLTIEGNTMLTTLSSVNDFEIEAGASVINDGVIEFGPFASLTEPNGYPITGNGYETTTRFYGSPLVTENSANLGLELTTDIGTDTTTIRRGHFTWMNDVGSVSIFRWFETFPQINTGLNATIRFHYDTTELNNLDANNLAIFESINAGLNWGMMASTPQPSSFYVETTGANSLYMYSLYEDESGITVPETELLHGFTTAPNPSSGEFTLHYAGEETGNLQLNLYNLQGQLVTSETNIGLYSGQSITLNYNDFPPGVYLLQLNLSGKVGVQKLIIE
jgi:hypothetical protein